MSTSPSINQSDSSTSGNFWHYRIRLASVTHTFGKRLTSNSGQIPPANCRRWAWVEGLAFNSTNNLLYASATVGPFADANRLITINPATAQPTSIAPSFFGPNFGDVDGLAVSSANGIVGSHINAPGPSLFSVNPVTGAGTAIGSLSAAVVGLDFAADGTLYGVTIPDIQVGGPSRLVTINPANGAIQDIGPIGFNTIQAIAFVPVPEPASAAFAVLAAAALLASRPYRKGNTCSHPEHSR